MPVTIGRETLVLVADGEAVYALDNRCPHMGFPLHRGSVHDGILTCHWHDARFDLASGGTFDLWADDVRTFPVEIRDDIVYVQPIPATDKVGHHHERLREGLQREINLVIGKSVIALLDGTADPVEPFRIGLDFGVRHRRAGWDAGLTIATCMVNQLPHLHTDNQPLALYQGLCAVAEDTCWSPKRFPIRPLPNPTIDLKTIKRWFRQFVEVRDAEGAERCIATAVRIGADHRHMADMLFSAVTDHRYIASGHCLDFTNKALEALDVAGWEHAEAVLTSLAKGYASADRKEEAKNWRSPVDLIALLEEAFDELPDAVEKGRRHRGQWSGEEKLRAVLLGEDARTIVAALLAALRDGATEQQLASAVTYAAALRIAQFHTSNEYADWNTALHTFSFAHAVHEGLRRAPSRELLRGVFDAAMSVYLDRFLNVPAARLPPSDDKVDRPEELLEELPILLDRQRRVDEAGRLVARYLFSGGTPKRLLAVLGGVLLREDRDFHTIQAVEAAFREYGALAETDAGVHVLVAAARYLAAHAPTARAQAQTYSFALRLHHGEDLHEEYPHGLTEREVELLRLLAGGKTDKQIADQLFISIKTVQTHVRNILAKIGANNRTEAASYAHRHGLINE